MHRCDCCLVDRKDLPFHHDAHDDSGDSWDYCQECYDTGCDLRECSLPQVAAPAPIAQPTCEVWADSRVGRRTGLRNTKGSVCGRPATKRVTEHQGQSGTWCCEPHASDYLEHFDAYLSEEVVTQEDVDKAIASIKAALEARR